MTQAKSTSNQESWDRPVVFIVDDDPLVRRSLEILMRAARIDCKTFSLAQEFLAYEPPPVPACLVLDVRMPGMDGLELQRVLSTREHAPPIIFISGYGNVAMSVQAMRAGAVDFLLKPFDDERLLAAIRHAIDMDRLARERLAHLADLRTRVATLTPRERDVFGLVTTGMTNREIAEQIGTTEKTVKVHRSRVMRKMNAGSLAQLVKIAVQLSSDTQGERLRMGQVTPSSRRDRAVAALDSTAERTSH